MRSVVEIGMTAYDSNVEVEDPSAEPSSAKSKQTFMFLVVGENELLSEIFREEEDLRQEMEKTQQQLKGAQTKLHIQVLSELETKDPERRSLKATRTSEVKTAIGMAARDIGAVHASFNRILMELKLNDVQKTSIGRVRNFICAPLARLLDKNNGLFKQAEDAAEKLQAVLEGKDNSPLEPAGADAKKKLDELVAELENIINAMQKIIDKDELIRLAIAMEEDQRKQTDALKALQDILRETIEKELKGLEDTPGDEGPKDKPKPKEEKKKRRRIQIPK
jgi:hypothetical protein